MGRQGQRKGQRRKPPQQRSQNRIKQNSYNQVARNKLRLVSVSPLTHSPCPQTCRRFLETKITNALVRCFSSPCSCSWNRSLSSCVVCMCICVYVYTCHTAQLVGDGSHDKKSKKGGRQIGRQLRRPYAKTHTYIHHHINVNLAGGVSQIDMRLFISMAQVTRGQAASASTFPYLPDKTDKTQDIYNVR